MFNSNAPRIRRMALFLAGQLLLLLPLTNLAVGQAQPSAVPRLVKFSGTINGAHESPRSGVVGLTFALYKDEQGGVPLWLETQNAALDLSGHYTVQLGATLPNGLPQELFVSGEARWLGVQPEGQAEQPRVLLVSVPYALKAGDAETLGGLPLSAFLLAAPPAASPGAGARASAIPGTSAAPPNAAVTGAGVVNFIPLWDTTSDIVNSVLSQTGTGTTAKIGINNSSPTSTLDVKGSSTVRGTLTLPPTSAATATAGKASQPLNLIGSTFNSGTATAVNQTFRLQTEPMGNNSVSPSGKLDLLYYAGANAAAETGLSIASNGQITFASGQIFPGTGSITGVAAGTGLTGGASSGNITLNLDTTKVPLLSAANIFTANQTVNANLAAKQLISTVAQGTAPLHVTSTTVVPNLNASLLGGLSASAFQPVGSYATLGANSFTGDQTVTGNATVTGKVSGGVVNATSAFNLQGSSFAYGSPTWNLFLGFSTGNTSATGTFNVGAGSDVLSVLTSGIGNVATGWDVLSANTTGSENTGTGRLALQLNNTGSSNTATGERALQNTTLGSSNTAVGVAALVYNTTGNNNTALGMQAGPDQSTPNLSNATAIGSNAVVTTSNSLVLGSINGLNGAVADTLVGIGTSAPAAKLDVHGTANFTGLISFAPGQTFPGTSTITGITAGTGLTGGGTTGNVTLSVDTTKIVTGMVAGTDLTGGGTGGVQTLNLDTSKVPQLNVANTFTGMQVINNKVGIGLTPQFPLHVSGMIRGESGLSLSSTGRFDVDAPFIPAGRLTVLPNGKVGINNPNPLTNLDVIGNVSASGSLIGGSLNVAGGGLISGGLTLVGGVSMTASATVGAGLDVTGDVTAGGNVAVGGSASVAGSVKINNDTPMSAAPHMYMSGFFPGNLTQSQVGAYVVPSKSILITRMSYVLGFDATYCTTSGSLGIVVGANTLYFFLNLNAGLGDSEPLSIPVAAGSQLSLRVIFQPDCPPGLGVADAAVSVEYVMQ